MASLMIGGLIIQAPNTAPAGLSTSFPLDILTAQHHFRDMLDVILFPQAHFEAYHIKDGGSVNYALTQFEVRRQPFCACRWC